MGIMTKALFTIIAALFFIITSFAQGNMEDVVYMKDGSIYRGQIQEIIPNQAVKIELLGGSVIALQMNDVTKITKEAKVQQQVGFDRQPDAYKAYKSDTTRKQFTFRKKGYFFQSQLLFENLQGGLRIINGYKFGRFGYLGIGVGVDFLLKDNFVIHNSGNGYADLTGVYLPLFLYHQGDILKKKITPFYTVEAGVAVSPGGFPFVGEDIYGGGDSRKVAGIGGLGFGVKFHTKRRVHFSLLANLNFKAVRYREENYYYDEFGNGYYYTNRGTATVLIPGLRFGIGF